MKEWINKYFTKQKMMHPLLVILTVLSLAATYFYGWRVLVLVVMNIFVACLTEYLFSKKVFQRGKISESCVVTAMLYTMTLPANLTYWISVVGIVFAILFGKMFFGGFGRNVFNPALVGRAFIYVNFPEPMTIAWNEVGKGPLGGFGEFLTRHIDDVSRATPMLLFRNSGEYTRLTDLFFGKVPGVIGETSKILILIAAVYLIYKKIASWEIMAGSVLGFVGMSTIFRLAGAASVPNPLYGMLMGGFILGTVLMATDPVSAAKTTPGKWVYGILVGLITVIIRGFALFSGGVMFAILIGNTFAPIIDYAFNKWKENRKKEAKVNG